MDTLRGIGGVPRRRSSQRPRSATGAGRPAILRNAATRGFAPILLLAAISSLACSRRQRSGTRPSSSWSSSTGSVTAPRASSGRVTTFRLVKVVDLGRHAVGSFAFCKLTRQLFVSFDQQSAPAELLQWSVAQARLVHTYAVEPGWNVDSLSAAPDGEYLVIGLYRDHGGGLWAKYGLLDPRRHRFTSADIGLHNVRGGVLGFSPDGRRFQLRHGVSGGRVTFDSSGRKLSDPPPPFPAQTSGRLSVIESSQSTLETRGLYYIDGHGQRHLITRRAWHENYDITSDGRFVAYTTWDGDVLVWSTAGLRTVFHRRIASAYGYLAYDPTGGRFLLADATADGTTWLRALVLDEAPRAVPIPAPKRVP